MCCKTPCHYKLYTLVRSILWPSSKSFLKSLDKALGVAMILDANFLPHSNTAHLALVPETYHNTSLVGSFHSHTHNHLCQLSYLAHYVKGMGLEDLEGCEWFFSKSNALASSLYYTSVFHHQQKIVEFMKHMDVFGTYHNLSKLSYFLFMYPCTHKTQVSSLSTTTIKPSTS